MSSCSARNCSTEGSRIWPYPSCLSPRPMTLCLRFLCSPHDWPAGVWTVVHSLRAHIQGWVTTGGHSEVLCWCGPSRSQSYLRSIIQNICIFESSFQIGVQSKMRPPVDARRSMIESVTDTTSVSSRYLTTRYRISSVRLAVKRACRLARRKQRSGRGSPCFLISNWSERLGKI